MVICVFIDGPIAGDVRTDFPRLPTIRIPVPPRETWCDCDPDNEVLVESGPEIVEYQVISHGERVAIYSCASSPTDQRLVDMMTSWMVTDLGNPKWVRHCRDRRAFT